MLDKLPPPDPYAFIYRRVPIALAADQRLRRLAHAQGVHPDKMMEQLIIEAMSRLEEQEDNLDKE